MAFVLATAGRNAIFTAGITPSMAGGSFDGYTTGHGTLLLSWTCQSPAFGAPNTGVATLLGVPLSATPSSNGVVAVFDAKQSSGLGSAVLGSGTAGLSGSGADMIMSNTTVATTQAVSLTSLTWTVPAS